jgi:uncharacterized protein involved in exopolysaccharide biosynthesis
LDVNTDDPNQNDEVDLKELFSSLWQSKLMILTITCLSLLLGVFYLQTATREYSVKITYKPMKDDNGGVKLGGLGGLASITGIALPSNSNSDFDVFIHLISSEEVAEIIYQNTELLKKVFRSEFDELNDTFRVPVVGRLGLLKKRVKSIITGQPIDVYRAPNPARLVPILNSTFSAVIDKKTGFLILYAETSNPDMVVELMEEAILAADTLLKQRYIESSSQSLKFYQQKIAIANSREHRDGLAKLIVNEQKKLMLASTGSNFVVERISRAQVSLHPVSPKAGFSLGLSLIIGICLGAGIAVIRHFVKIKKLY